MPRQPTTGKKGFIWLPLDPTEHAIEVSGDDVTEDCLEDAEFVWGVCPEVGSFKIKLINIDSAYTDKYSQGDIVTLKGDRVSGTTEIYKGVIDKINNVEDSSIGWVLEISGGHLTTELNNVLVTKSYDGSFTCDEIFKQLVDEYLSGYTYSGVTSSTVKPTISWEEKPFWDCIYDLCKVAKTDNVFDARLEVNKDFSFFENKSVDNTSEHAVLGDTLIEVNNLGTQTITTKNEIRVYGDDGDGLPIYYSSNESASQTSYGVKEMAIFENKINSVEQAKERADAESLLVGTPESEGEVVAFFLPTLKPGENLRVSNPNMGINDNYNVYKVFHKPISVQTKVAIGTERKMPQLFKKRVEAELASQTITNPYRMSQTINRMFDGFGELTTYDSNLTISSGKIKLSSGTQGVFTFNESLSLNIVEAHLRMAGTELLSVQVELSTDGGNTYTPLGLNERSILGSFGGGSNVFVRVTINSATTEIDGISIGVK